MDKSRKRVTRSCGFSPLSFSRNAVSSGLPPTGARIELRGITVWRIVDGKIREEWTSFDDMQAAQQLVTQLKRRSSAFLPRQ
jgi:predicted ester cyclase